MKILNSETEVINEIMIMMDECEGISLKDTANIKKIYFNCEINFNKLETQEKYTSDFWANEIKMMGEHYFLICLVVEYNKYYCIERKDKSSFSMYQVIENEN